MDREKGRLSYREGKHRLKSIRWMLFWIAAIQTLAIGVFSVLSEIFSVSPPFWIQMLIIELSAYLFPIILYARENKLLTLKEARERFGLCPCQKNLWLLVALAGIGCQSVMVILNLPVTLMLGQEDGYIPQSILELMLAIVIVGAIPAFFEEFLFRGIVFGVMKEVNDKAAVIFTTLMFAFMHGNIAGFLGYLFLGWASVLILKKTGSLYACMTFHFVNNATALILSYLSPALLYMPTVTIIIFIIGIILAIGVFGYFMVTHKHQRPVRLIKTSVLLEQSFVNLPIILCIICVLFTFIRG